MSRRLDDVLSVRLRDLRRYPAKDFRCTGEFTVHQTEVPSDLLDLVPDGSEPYVCIVIVYAPALGVRPVIVSNTFGPEPDRYDPLPERVLYRTKLAIAALALDLSKTVLSLDAKLLAPLPEALCAACVAAAVRTIAVGVERHRYCATIIALAVEPKPVTVASPLKREERAS